VEVLGERLLPAAGLALTNVSLIHPLAQRAPPGGVHNYIPPLLAPRLAGDSFFLFDGVSGYSARLTINSEDLAGNFTGTLENLGGFDIGPQNLTYGTVNLFGQVSFFADNSGTLPTGFGDHQIVNFNGWFSQSPLGPSLSGSLSEKDYYHDPWGFYLSETGTIQVSSPFLSAGSGTGLL
jgi:hypothetical protein